MLKVKKECKLKMTKLTKIVHWFDKYYGEKVQGISSGVHFLFEPLKKRTGNSNRKP